MPDTLAGKRVLVTQAGDYMGPAVADLFSKEGATVTRSTDDLVASDAAARVVAEAGDIDILVANLAHPPMGAPAEAIDDDAWNLLFDRMVHPLMRLVRSVLPQMLSRGHGKIVAVTSAAPIRGIPRFSAYCAARGAQNAFVRSVGLEVAPRGVQVNAIAQNYVRNDTYFPEGLVSSEKFQTHVARDVPIGRIAEPEESAALALFLASESSNFIVGQVVPFAGGWTTASG